MGQQIHILLKHTLKTNKQTCWHVNTADRAEKNNKCSGHFLNNLWKQKVVHISEEITKKGGIEIVHHNQNLKYKQKRSTLSWNRNLNLWKLLENRRKIVHRYCNWALTCERSSDLQDFKLRTRQTNNWRTYKYTHTLRCKCSENRRRIVHYYNLAPTRAQASDLHAHATKGIQTRAAQEWTQSEHKKKH